MTDSTETPTEAPGWAVREKLRQDKSNVLAAELGVVDLGVDVMEAYAKHERAQDARSRECTARGQGLTLGARLQEEKDGWIWLDRAKTAFELYRSGNDRNTRAMLWVAEYCMNQFFEVLPWAKQQGPK